MLLVTSLALTAGVALPAGVAGSTRVAMADATPAPTPTPSDEIPSPDPTPVPPPLMALDHDHGAPTDVIKATYRLQVACTAGALVFYYWDNYPPFGGTKLAQSTLAADCSTRVDTLVAPVGANQPGLRAIWAFVADGAGMPIQNTLVSRIFHIDSPEQIAAAQSPSPGASPGNSASPGTGSTSPCPSGSCDASASPSITPTAVPDGPATPGGGVSLPGGLRIPATVSLPGGARVNSLLAVLAPLGLVVALALATVLRARRRR